MAEPFALTDDIVLTQEKYLSLSRDERMRARLTTMAAIAATHGVDLVPGDRDIVAEGSGPLVRVRLMGANGGDRVLFGKWSGSEITVTTDVAESRRPMATSPKTSETN